ncbi:hypothetical protein N5923_05870 [Erwiniaceae bacterium BAC15a-03b]|uniref:Uncharacterized protein n=1 Tax=Winslowiella arboricola TaxID=2978220 RepID=A0A9J6PI30_9GAMM|nr:hypothetical protein [Winslowiella arboricola]MCU5774049.1 hypothetical protein [Winslowiella arboricola]MCU5777018.1 hypothetical protein [Winslowiella arboricola]
MSDLSIQGIHDYCLSSTQLIIDGFGWGNISLGVLSEEDKHRLAESLDQRVLNWSWGMEHYRGNADNDGILDINLKVVDHHDPDSLHAVIICKYDIRRDEFAICMLENFIADEETPLTGNVLMIALIYSTTFCDMVGLEDVYIQDPTDAVQPRYKSYGFAQVVNAHNKMSAEVPDIRETIRRKVNGIGPDEE